jgi:hypothetical protein
MPSDIPSIDDLELEARLSRLLPSGPDAALFHRLAAAADGTLASLTPAEQTDEDAMRRFQPVAVNGALMARLEAVVAHTPFPVDEKIVLFPKAPLAVARRRKLPGIAVAAAVALLGAAAALLTPGTHPADGGGAPTTAGTPAPAPDSVTFVPTRFDRGFSHASDQGVLWQGVAQPHRVMRVEYLDKATFVNGRGETVEIEQPQVEFILVPEKID